MILKKERNAISFDKFKKVYKEIEMWKCGDFRSTERQP